MFDIIAALRARGKNDGLAQLAADEIERLRAIEPVNIERSNYGFGPEALRKPKLAAERTKKPPAKMTAAKKAKK
jgi:hypothetical protein